MLKLNSCLLIFLMTLKYNVQCVNLKYNEWQSFFEKLDGQCDHVTATSWGPARFDVFAATSNGGIWTRTFANSIGGWSGGWISIGGSPARKPSAHSTGSDKIDVMYTGADKRLYRKTWNGQAWSDWKVDPTGAQFSSGPSITSESHYLHVFAIGADSALYHNTINILGAENNWSKWESLGGAAVGDPAAVSWGAGRLDVFVIAGDSQLWQKTYNGAWQNWNLVPGGSFHPAGVGAASMQPGILNVFMRGKADDAIYYREYANSKWGDLVKVGGAITSSPSAASPGSTRVDVFAVGVDNVVYRNFWDSLRDSIDAKFGCFKGQCWTQCGDEIGKDGNWCYTTVSGVKEDYKFVSCQTYDQCKNGYWWRCATRCGF